MGFPGEQVCKDRSLPAVAWPWERMQGLGHRGVTGGGGGEMVEHRPGRVRAVLTQGEVCKVCQGGGLSCSGASDPQPSAAPGARVGGGMLLAKTRSP